MKDILTVNLKLSTSVTILITYLYKQEVLSMPSLTRILLSVFVLSDSLFDYSSASAFAITPIYSLTHGNKMKPTLSALTTTTTTNAPFGTTNDALRIRGGGPPSSRVQPVAASLTSTDSAPATAKGKRVRIAAFDSMRFFLICMIVLGHFVKFANPSDFVFNLLSQHNVVVGAFFALSGYVTAYTSTEIGQRAASPKLLDTPKQKWVLSKVFGYYPLHLLVLLLFSPMFLYADVHYSGWLIALWHGFLSATLTQAWFPMHAEVWNAPTWFLSALTFATALLPFSLPSMAKMNKPQLRRSAGWLFLINLLPKLGYFYDFAGAASLMEGITSPKQYPNLAVFNMQRFHPLFLVAEIMLGAVACRLVMLDDAPGEEPRVSTNALSTLVPFVGMGGILLTRAFPGVLQVSDLLVRSVIFVPLFLRFLMAVHRNTVRSVKDPTVAFLSNKLLVGLGNLSFPIFIVHGPIGQVFYKKMIATKLFGRVLTGPEFFGTYLVTVLMSAWLLQQMFLQSKAVGNWSKKTVDQLASWM
jgi:peptidoglycan/LPS O-acetylase OafA/YrhL